MKNRLILSIIILTALLLIASAGCIESEETGTAGPAAVSISSTPVSYADVNGVSLGYREFGAGEPIILLQGFSGTMDGWNETFISILASKYHVYIYDHRGMGYSSDNDATPSIPQFADDAAGLISALGYESMHVYGVSMGSAISQQLVIDDPEAVRKLVLSSNSYSVRINETATLLGLVEATAADPTQPEGTRKEAEAILAWNGTQSGLSGIEKDVMLIVGTDDELTPNSISVTMAGQIDGSWLVRFKGIPHVGSDYAPEEYGDSVLNFLGMDESPGS